MENNVRRTVRFPRETYDVRAQAGLGILHLYFEFDLAQAGDFLAGLVFVDPLKDDVRPDPKILREPARQLGRGLTNLVVGVLEVPRSMHRVNQDHGGWAGATFGFFRGFWRFGVREVTGVFEIVTFPFGWAPIIEPEFPYQAQAETDWRVNPMPFKKKN